MSNNIMSRGFRGGDDDDDTSASILWVRGAPLKTTRTSDHCLDLETKMGFSRIGTYLYSL